MKPAAETNELFPSDEIRAQLTALHGEIGHDASALNAAVLSLLKDAVKHARSAIETRLSEDGKGLKCAARLSAVQDELIRVAYDFAVTHVYPVRNRSTAEHLTIVAVGGYGRGTLAPGSDIDLLFLRPYKQTPWGETVIEYILYLLWDLGFKVGHATRSVAECMRLSKADMTIRTSLLEARWIWGETGLFEEFQDKFDKQVVAGSAPEFINAKLGERDDRHKRSGSSRYVVEPNVKDGKGGLRDLHTLFWIAKYFYRVRTKNELVTEGVFTRADLSRFNKSEDFLWAVRCHLHFLTGSSEERLSFDLQREMATRLGYTSHPGMRDVERFMKHYFLIAKEVGDLTRILCASLELRQAKAPGVLSTLIQRVVGTREDDTGIEGTKDFVLKSGRLAAVRDDVFEKDPLNLLRLFWHADRNNVMFHPDVLSKVRRSLRMVDKAMRNDPRANAIFMDILTSPNDPEAVLRRMNECGLLGRFVPEFGKIVSLVQFNMYHHYTVDEHLIRSIGALSNIERGRRSDAHPLADTLIGTLKNRRLLFVALFLHDIAKGRPEDHSIAGARIARRLCPRFGLDRAETETVAWLIEEHLTMSSVAQSRDLSDPRTIEDFAERAQSLERLKMLLILTIADIVAVGPGVWNGWKGQLLRTLYYATEPLLTGGHTEVPRTIQTEQGRADLRRMLSEWDDAAFETYAARHHDAYWLTVPLERQVEQARMVADAEARGERFAFDVSTDAFRAVTRITIAAPDSLHLLSTIAGVCTAGGANIAASQVFTTTDGLALDTVFVRRTMDDDAEEIDFATRLVETIEGVVRGETRLADRVARRTKRARSTRMGAFSHATDVTLSNTLSDRYTVVEVSGLDRAGLLYDLTHAIAALNLTIGSAHITTFGERAVDTFYVTDLMGEKIETKARQTRIRNRLRAVFDGEAPAATSASKATRKGSKAAA
ncbi:MAG: [protein-PII] uridylyltransferase [Pseudomonadota bacterium]